MAISKFTDSRYDKLIWEEIWKKAAKENWSIEGIIRELSVDTDLSEPTLWRCRALKTKWHTKTREKLYKYVGYNSVDEYKTANVIENPEPISLPETIGIYPSYAMIAPTDNGYNMPPTLQEQDVALSLPTQEGSVTMIEEITSDGNIRIRSKKRGDIHVKQLKSKNDTEMIIRHSGAVTITHIHTANDTIIDSEDL